MTSSDLTGSKEEPLSREPPKLLGIAGPPTDGFRTSTKTIQV